MNRFNLLINNSFCEFSQDIPIDIESQVQQILTYKNDVEGERGQIFYMLRYARGFKREALLKKLKVIEANEWVCWYKNKKFPTGHLNIVKDLLDALNASYIVTDTRQKPNGSLILTWKNKPHKPRYYQEDMIKLGLTEGRGVFESAVGTGKTLVATYLIKEISVKSLIIVPSRGLKDQIYNDMVEAFGTKHVQKIESAHIRKNKLLKSIRVVTIQTIAALKKTNDLHMLMHDVEALFIDEIHHAGSKSYTDILPDIDHIYWRFGFTGTFLRNDCKSLDMWGFLSTKLYSYPAWKAIEDGFLTPVEVRTYELAGKQSRSYPKEYTTNYCGGKEILNKVLEIVQTVEEGKQILILVNRKDKAGKIFHEVLNAYGINNSYISGDDKTEVITQTIKKFNDKEVNVLIGSSVIGEGIDVRSADHLIMCQGGKSEIVIVQAVGRLVRLFEGKDIGIVHDFRFTNTKYMKKHLNIRLNIYERNFQPKFSEAA